ncbi:MAG: hypothetical protein QW512_03920 [Thermofilaceae archaeon]
MLARAIAKAIVKAKKLKGSMSIKSALSLPLLVVGIVVLVAIVVALWGTLEQNLAQLANVNSTNPLVTAIRPALPLLVGVALLLFLLFPIAVALRKLKW